MAETIWNENLEVSHQKGDKKMKQYRKGTEKKKLTTGKMKSDAAFGSVGANPPKPTERVFLRGKAPTEEEWDKMSRAERQKYSLEMQKAQETAVHGKVKEKTTKIKVKTKDKKIKVEAKKDKKKYRKGGSISYSGIYKSPNSKSKFPGMG